jgi:hypothetical protein
MLDKLIDLKYRQANPLFRDPKSQALDLQSDLQPRKLRITSIVRSNFNIQICECDILSNNTTSVTYDHRLRSNWASRPLCHTQALDRQISSWVGDHQRIPAVVCFCIFWLAFSVRGEILFGGAGSRLHSLMKDVFKLLEVCSTP